MGEWALSVVFEVWGEVNERFILGCAVLCCASDGFHKESGMEPLNVVFDSLLLSVQRHGLVDVMYKMLCDWG